MKKKLNCVLLVDDNESDNFLHKRIIEKAYITDHVQIAEDGKEALDFFLGKREFGQPESSYCRPELIFLDINMPVMDGWQFLYEYNKLEDVQQGKTVVIILTTSLNPNDRIQSEKLFGSGHYQYKPLTLELIHEIIQKHFPDYL